VPDPYGNRAAPARGRSARPEPGASAVPALTVMQLLPALESGGVERSTIEIAAALVAAGHRARVISAGGRLLPELLATGAEHLALGIDRKSPLTFRHVPALRRLFAGVDIVHARSRLPAWLAWRALAGMASPPRFVTTVHGLNSPGRYSAILTRGERVICVSQAVRRHLERHYPDLDSRRLVVIPRGIDRRAFPRASVAPQQARRAGGWDWPDLVDGRLLLLPGRGTRLKGHRAAIMLLAGLRAQGIDARLLLAGAEQGGRDRYLASIRRAAQAAGVATWLRITPPRADMARLYAGADLVLQLSERPEAFGRTVLEALAVGRPVLGWNHGGVGELLAELYPAGVVAVGAHDVLLAATGTLLQTPPPVPVTIPYSLESMQTRTLDLYAQLHQS